MPWFDAQISDRLNDPSETEVSTSSQLWNVLGHSGMIYVTLPAINFDNIRHNSPSHVRTEEGGWDDLGSVPVGVEEFREMAKSNGP